MANLREWIDRLEGAVTAWADGVVDRWPALVPLLAASLIVVLLSLDDGRALGFQLGLIGNLLVGAAFFIVFYLEMQMRRKEDSQYSKYLRVVSKWTRRHPFLAMGIMTIALGILVAGAVLTPLTD